MLQARKKLTKREIKEDPLVTAYGKVRLWLLQNNKIVNTTAIAVLVLMTLTILMARSKRQAQIRAEGQLGMSEQYYHFGQYDRAIDDLARIVNTFPGTLAAGKAAFFLANSYFETKEFEKAETYYRLYLDDYADMPLFTVASMEGLAACLEIKEQFGDAAAMYFSAYKRFDETHSAPFLLRNAARCYRAAGNLDEAKKMYGIIQSEFADSQIANEVAAMLKSIS